MEETFWQILFFMKKYHNSSKVFENDIKKFVLSIKETRYLKQKKGSEEAEPEKLLKHIHLVYELPVTSE